MEQRGTIIEQIYAYANLSRSKTLLSSKAKIFIHLWLAVIYLFMLMTEKISTIRRKTGTSIVIRNVQYLGNYTTIHNVIVYLKQAQHL